jgi:hypothetical protein
VWSIVLWYTLEQCVILYDTYVKYRSAKKCRLKFHHKFFYERVPSRQTIHNLVKKFRSTGLLTDKEQKCKHRVLSEETFSDIWARIEHTPRKSLKHLAQETGVSKSCARTATQLLKLRPYKTTVIHALHCRDPAIWVHFCSWFLQPVFKDEIDPQLTFFSDVVWFHLYRYINTQNNCCWSSQNPHLTHKVLLHPVKVGVWCAVGARIVGPLFF